jgi:hypothetical protein
MYFTFKNESAGMATYGTDSLGTDQEDCSSRLALAKVNETLFQ